MAKDETGKQGGRQVRQALEGMGGQGEHSGAGPHVTPLGAGSQEFDQMESLLGKQIHLIGPSNQDRAVFCRQLATMIDAGIPLLRALQMLSKRTPHRKLAKAIQHVAQQVEAGQSVSSAMEERVQIFTPLVVNIVRVGEVGGILEESLARLAQIIESKSEITRKIRSAMMYPAVAICVAFLVVVAILIYAIPVFSEVYANANTELPQATRIVMAFSDLALKVWLWAPILIAAIVGWVLFSRTPRGKWVTSYLSLKLPIVGRIARKIGVARFSRTLSGLLSAGIPLIEGLSISADTNENLLIGDALRRVQGHVETGEKMGLPLAQTGIFPALVVDMISIGEETGTLDIMLEKIADVYDADVDSSLTGFASIIEPLLIVLLGGMVIFIALAVLLPYFNMVSVI